MSSRRIPKRCARAWNNGRRWRQDPHAAMLPLCACPHGSKAISPRFIGWRGPEGGSRSHHTRPLLRFVICRQYPTNPKETQAKPSTPSPSESGVSIAKLNLETTKNASRVILPNGAAVSGLSRIVETGKVPQGYSMSPRRASVLARRLARWTRRKTPPLVAEALSRCLKASSPTAISPRSNPTSITSHPRSQPASPTASPSKASPYATSHPSSANASWASPTATPTSSGIRVRLPRRAFLLIRWARSSGHASVHPPIPPRQPATKPSETPGQSTAPAGSSAASTANCTPLADPLQIHCSPSESSKGRHFLDIFDCFLKPRERIQ